ncbi:hypothetical protein F1188_11945 [Roseospira marina]|uniref:RcnB family protein n=1 Tax=Roseospira marina TaxID=140057 RepID=A0A5M6IAN8_9PROT|nr:hypothetical protein [Roseospira marina]KAA5605273.1 hypothetical protein F1188_11945 [Roseospira marina]MBB4314734.1 hypothetical protein [Roseospira marina]MBB5087723.1 hypothetical protein [Roseospira marina]
MARHRTPSRPVRFARALVLAGGLAGGGLPAPAAWADPPDQPRVWRPDGPVTFGPTHEHRGRWTRPDRPRPHPMPQSVAPSGGIVVTPNGDRPPPGVVILPQAPQDRPQYRPQHRPPHPHRPHDYGGYDPRPYYGDGVRPARPWPGDTDAWGNRYEEPPIYIRFGIRDRQLIVDYFEPYRDGRKPLPPGLARRRGHLSPDIARRGGVMPPGVRSYALPWELAERLPPPQAGFERVIVGRDVLLIERTTGLIADVLRDVL